MLTPTRRLTSARATAWASLVPLTYFVAEWIVSATWRGNYSYRDDLVGPLGIAFCGPTGEWPCSALYPAMNVGLILSGLAVVVVAAGFLARQVTARGHAILLGGSGLGLAVSGVLTNEIDYSWNLTAIVAFMTLGAVSVLFIAFDSQTPMTVERRGIAVLAGVVSLLGYFAFMSGHNVFGSGGAQRMAVYGILVAVMALGSAGLRRRPVPADGAADSQELVREPS